MLSHLRPCFRPADPTGSGSDSPGGALSSTISTVPQMALYKVVNGTKGARVRCVIKVVLFYQLIDE
ncbi:hypothetical protein DPMN_031337 [Dreissena polymorpha]|uniref:Uncharacterized protein n=1 Tax=Dreissena polymorpha TaxID=45954 RepID=A0A9D4M2W9_DREPO|nr:hypothetical protein DPMN_031337 [Dreissena polymorpha]